MKRDVRFYSSAQSHLASLLVHDQTKNSYVSRVHRPRMASLEPLAWNTSWLEPVILMPVDWNQSPLPEPAVSMCRVCCPSVIFNNNTNFPYNYHWFRI